MTKLLLIGIGATATLSFASCAPLHTNAMHEDRGRRVHGPD
ncbi:MAG: hypothetical protein ABGZ49_05100 [Akkermansiaceae bacterium]|jgi:hypothetical protein|nr:hypothetical protein [Roseibacillus sp.]